MEGVEYFLIHKRFQQSAFLQLMILILPIESISLLLEVSRKTLWSSSLHLFGKLSYFCSTTECIDQMVANVNTKKDICPTFSAIVQQLDEYSLQQRQHQSSQDSVCEVDDITVELNGVNDINGDRGCELDDGSYDNGEACSFDHNDDAYHADDGFDPGDQNLADQYEVFLSSSFMYIRFGHVYFYFTKNG